MNDATDIVKRLEKMSDRDARYDYDIGDFWNATEEAATYITDLREAVRVLSEESYETRSLVSEFEVYTTPHVIRCRLPKCGCRANDARDSVNSNPIARQAIEDAKKGMG